MNCMNKQTNALPLRFVAQTLLSMVFFSGLPAAGLAADNPQALVQEMLSLSGVKGGIILHLGSGDGQLTAALRANDRFQVQGLDRDGKNVEAARQFISKQGVYGTVSVDRLYGAELPYVDNFINLVVAEDANGITEQEIQRVLAPNGVACLKQGGTWKKIVKPRPSTMDEWTHYYYDAKGNPASKDLVVAPPDRLQWVGNPRWSRHHDRMSSLSAQVSAAGRLYYIMDEGSRISILLPPKWTLTARDAFNGTVLWRQHIEKWNTHMWPLKSGPTQLARRLVASGEDIFVTLAIDAPVSRIDGATGKSLQVYANTAGTEEILHVNGVLYLLVNPDLWSLTDFAPKHNTGDQKRVETEFNWDEKKRVLMAVDVASGKMLWKQEGKIAPLTLAADGKRLVYHNGESLVGLNPSTGAKIWSSVPEGKRKLFEYNYGPRVLITKDMILYAGGDGAMKGLNAQTGKELWNAPHQKSGYRSPEDLIVAGGLVWNAPTTSGGMSGIFTGRDPVTGEVKKEFPPDVDTYWFHHRCYIAKATDKFLLPSRTGIEFVDIDKKTWDINHWVRASCLYGCLPCNGLVYAGPHNCACYPEAKLDGMNALCGVGSAHPKPRPESERLEKGPAYGQPLVETESDKLDWPTYRHDPARSGFSDQPLADNLDEAWNLELPGPLSALTIAAGKVFVSQVDRHTLHALDSKTGKPLWNFIAGARVDSPPTYWKGRVFFGCKDGWVYCLRAQDGVLIWRYQAAGADQRHGGFEQIESVWPVHGSVLVTDGVVSCVAGRSVFLDGGLRFVRMEATTGKKLVETVYDSKNPETGKDLQELVKTLQMPVGLNDILSTDGKYLYLRSQKIKTDGTRVDIAPVSGNAAEQGGAQRGEGAHIFAPMGFLDDSWFHRSYWVYGKHFAGGHNGYYQAGKYTPAGRILVHDEKNVYGYGRLPQYYKWTTTMEHQLFSASKEAPEVAVEPTQSKAQKKAGKAGKAGGKAGGKAAATGSENVSTIKFDADPKLDPTKKPLTISVWVLPEGPNGVLVSHGGGNHGYALVLEEGQPAFAVRVTKTEGSAVASRPLGPGWHHLAGILNADGRIQLFVDGELAAEAKGPGLMTQNPNLGLQLGACGSSLVTAHGQGIPFTGMMDQFALWHKALDMAEISKLANQATVAPSRDGLVVALNFDKANANDTSGNSINGIANSVQPDKGKAGTAMHFGKPGAPVAPILAAKKGSITTGPVAATPAPAGAKAGSFVPHGWDRKVPLFTRAMAMAGKTVFVSGPPDKIDEEYAFERLTQKDQSIQEELAEQDAALDGKRGALLYAVSTETGQVGSQLELQSPPVWDGMAVAHGRLYVASQDGRVRCYGKPKQ